MWIPPEEEELNDTEEVQIHKLMGDELGPDAARVLVMLDQIDDPFRPQPDGPVVTTMWRDPQ